MQTDTSAACEIIRECANAIEETSLRKGTASLSLADLREIMMKHSATWDGKVSIRVDVVAKLREIANREEAR